MKEDNKSMSMEVREEPTHEYDENGELVAIDQTPLTRKQRREIERAKKRRAKKLRRLRFQIEKEKEKLERKENTGTETNDNSSD